MFRKTRKIIVISIVALLVFFLAVTLSTIYISSYLSVNRNNRVMLDKYLELYELEMVSDNPKPQGPENGPDGELLTPPEEGEDPPIFSNNNSYWLYSFYSAALTKEGKVLATDTSNSEIYKAEDIIALSKEVLEKDKRTGRLDNLIYKLDERPGYTLVAFMDITVTNNNMRTLFINTMLVGIISIGVLFIISISLAKRIVHPLEENDMRQKRFVSDAEHELKTPISVVNANAELLYREIGNNQWLSNIQYENEKMSNLVKELLDLSHVENGIPDVEEVDFSNLVKQEVLPFEGIAFENGHIIQAQIEDRIIIKGNEKQLGQLVGILTDNAISHASGPGEICISLKKEHRQVILRVTNPGHSIDEDKKEHLFDRFYRLDEARVDNEGHFGLGLSIAKAITEIHKGSIRVECQEGNVTFTVNLPMN
ncbi:MAG: HAMP domain-containing histidine kinase [Eubacterium sp.]|nr:HAMP domain-containing histidine kinase [Eubacterium sp.]